MSFDTPTAAASKHLGGPVVYHYTSKHHRHRYYDARQRGFLSRDPAEADDLGNLYAAFSNNPGTMIDPLGLDDNSDKSSQAMGFIIKKYSISSFRKDVLDGTRLAITYFQNS